MPEIFTLRRASDGLTKTLAAWGVTGQPTFRHCAAGATAEAMDELTLAFDVPVQTTPAFGFAERIELFNGAGERVFVGWARYPKISASGNEQRQVIVFQGPDRFLRSTMVGSANFRVGGSLTVAAASAFVMNANPEIDGTITRVSLPTQLDAILSFAKNHGVAGGGTAPFDYVLTGVPNVSLNEMPVRNATCASAIEQVQSVVQSLNRRWDYTFKADGTTPAEPGDNPVLRFVFVKTISDSGAPQMPALYGSGNPTVHTIPNDGTVLAQFSPEPDDEKLVGKLTVLFTSEGDAGNAVLTEQDSVIDNGSAVIQVIPIELRGAAWNGVSILDPESVPGDNLARLIHMGGYDRVWWSFRGTTTGPTRVPRWEWRPGDLVNLSSAGTALAAAFSMIQVVTRNLFTGETQIDTGTPSQRGLGKLSYLRSAGGAQPTPGGGQMATGKKDESPRSQPPGPTGATGSAGLPATFVSYTYDDDGHSAPSIEVVLADELDNTWDFKAHNLGPLLNTSVDVTSTGGASTGSFTFTGPRTWKLALALNIPPGVTYAVVDSVTTLAAGSDATAAVTLTDTTLHFAFGIPRGATGDTGATGAPGDSHMPDPTGLGNGRYVLRMTGGTPSWEAE